MGLGVIRLEKGLTITGFSFREPALSLRVTPRLLCASA